MKEGKVEEFLNKVDRPWGMSMTELEQFQSEVKQLKSEQNKVAVEKLEEFKGKLREADEITISIGYLDKVDTFELLNEFIKELKEKN